MKKDLEFKLPDLEDELSVLKTIRMKTTTLNKINEISAKTDIPVNRLLNECIEFALNHLSDDEVERIRKKKNSTTGK